MLQEYNLDIKHIHGIDNVCADALSGAYAIIVKPYSNMYISFCHTFVGVSNIT